ncbi:MAG: class I SAM-dependent methyltransferase [Saprospiraceae bacterium]|nr:class I SAM-dependent methyltransferase [Saprospiraceae bacterium]
MNYFQQNRESWNELTFSHTQSEFYDLQNFINGRTSLNSIEIQEIGEVNRKKILHLQCHFGMDTLSFARMGAEVVGIDISDESIKYAKQLTKNLQLNAKFIRSNVYEADLVLDESFDIIYTSYGAINWLNNLNEWGRIIKSLLKPDGVFYMIEFHPYIYTLDNNLEIQKDYFNVKPIKSIVNESYTDNSKVNKKNLVHIEWHHSLSEVINSLINNGLQIEFVNEFPYQAYNCFDNMIEIEKGKWVFERYKDLIPYMFSIRAINKAQ